MRSVPLFFPVLLLALGASSVWAQKKERPYRLESVNLKERIIWGAELREPNGFGLSFGGQDQQSDDGRPHTRVWKNGKWVVVYSQLRARNPLQNHHQKLWELRNEVKNVRARARAVYFKGLPAEEEAARVKTDILPRLSGIRGQLDQWLKQAPKGSMPYATGQIAFARSHLLRARERLPRVARVIKPWMVGRLRESQIQIEIAAEALDAEPPARAMHCGKPRKREGAVEANAIAYDPKSKLYVIFGGDHFDYLTNDTWVFDPQKEQWQQRHPKMAPPPRANHQLMAHNGKVRLQGGYTYSSNTDYLGGQYRDLDDGEWVYDIAKDEWQSASGNTESLMPSDSRTYRTGPFHPSHYLQGPRPDAAKFEEWLKKIPLNEWVATNPPYRPRLNRDWGTARIDPDRDLILRWSGGHSAHGGTDVPHFHFSTNRWEMPYPVELPLGQLYSNTSYPNGYNFNLRPWMTGHTYQNYAYDPPSRKMVKAGRPHHYYVYDPDVADWISRGPKPKAMQYNSCFYTLTLTATPQGAVCWDRNGRVHRFDAKKGQWLPWKLTGNQLPGAYVDNSTICYDSKRDRLLMINKNGFRTPFGGQVWSVDCRSHSVKALSPAGMDLAKQFANIDKCCYDAGHDLMILGSYLRDRGDWTPTPAYDCAKNQWVTLDLKYRTGKRSKRTTRAMPHSRSDGLMFDARRKLLWGTDTNSQVYVLRLDLSKAGLKPLENGK